MPEQNRGLGEEDEGTWMPCRQSAVASIAQFLKLCRCYFKCKNDPSCENRSEGSDRSCVDGSPPFMKAS